MRIGQSGFARTNHGLHWSGLKDSITMAYIDFISLIHKSTTRDYVARVTEYPKAKAAEKAKTWGYDYWDGDRRWGYGGMTYDGRWLKVAKAMAEHYGIKPGDKILDVGCGKGFLMHDFTLAVPGVEVFGLIFPNMPKPIQKRKSASQLQLETQAIFHGVTILSISWFRSILFTTFRIMTSIQPFGRFRGSEKKRSICA